MKNHLLLSCIISVCIFSLPIYSQVPGSNEPNKSYTGEGVSLSFITVNNYGNNLYIDNVNIGKQYSNDIFVSSIDNIKADTSYSIGSDSYTIAPKVTVTNVGRAAVASAFNVTLSISPGGYSNTKHVPSLLSGVSYQIVFDNITITPGTALNISAQSNYTLDENPMNDQLNQYSLILPGVQRNVLLEEWTSSTCGPCAANNPTIDAFIEGRFDSLVSIKYHVGWPSPGNDPMYLYNTTQSYDRRYYYGVNAVPHVIMDGVANPDYPYSNAPSLPTAFYSRKPIGSPVSIAVTDERIAGDSIRATVNITVHAPLMFGDYRLRVMAVERKITYASAPGTNGEKVFYDVFRKSFPGSEGITFNITPGNYSFVYTYKVDKIVWVDSMMYTTAFVQNDLTKEVINCGKARHHIEKNIFVVTPPAIDFKARSFADDISDGHYSTLQNSNKEILGGFNVEFFEASFPPAGWRVVNPDGGITFEKYEGANGPSFGGSKSVRLDFYDYSTAGRKDSMISRVYYNIETSDTIKFDWAYAIYPGYADSLIVKLSTDGGVTFPYEIFRKGGSGLATAPSTTSSFVPTPNQWQTFAYPLTDINVPVELTSFVASVVAKNVELTWTTATEINNMGFEIEKSFDGNNFIKIGFVEGRGTSSEAHNYLFTDKPDLQQKTKFNYRLRQVDFDGKAKYSIIVNVFYDVPDNVALNQNYPNPFNPTTTINYSIAETAPVTLKIYDVTGREVSVLVDEVKQPGRYEITFDASSLASGVYFYKLNAGSFSSVKKLSVLK